MLKTKEQKIYGLVYGRFSNEEIVRIFNSEKERNEFIEHINSDDYVLHYKKFGKSYFYKRSEAFRECAISSDEC